MFRILGLLTILMGLAQAAEPAVATRSALLWDLEALTRVREHAQGGDATLAAAVGRLCKDADRVLGKPLDAVTDKANGGLLADGQDPHDYRSLSTYYWPDPHDSKAPWIKRDGDGNREGIAQYDSPRLRRAADRIRDGALAWWFSGKDEYATDAVAQLRHWFLAPATAMNPHLNYAQFVPGKNGAQGNAHGLIDTRCFVDMLSAVRLLEVGGRLPEEDQQGLRAWFRAYLDWLTTSDLGVRESKASNNHGLYYDAQVVAFALYLGDGERARSVMAEVGPRRLAKQIAPDGSMPHELGRPTAGTYLCFTLEAVVQLVALERNAKLDTDLWAWSSSDGRSLAAALRWTLPYVLEGKAWDHGRAEDPIKPARVGRMIHNLTAAGVDTGLTEVLSRFPIPREDRLRLLAPVK